MILQWLESRTDEQLFRASVGNDPSLADLMKMVHPNPGTASRAALFGYLIGRAHDAAALPEFVKQFEEFKPASGRSAGCCVPVVDRLAITAKPTGVRSRRSFVADDADEPEHLFRHGVFDNEVMVKLVANRLASADAVKRARVFPYQLLMAFKAAGGDVPNLIRDALQDAMEVATENIPCIAGKVYVCPDVSGSMGSAVTGQRTGATTLARCVDVAALVAASILRQNPQAEVVPFAPE